ncbi:unnamed protein product [Prunus brigantina]
MKENQSILLFSNRRRLKHKHVWVQIMNHRHYIESLIYQTMLLEASKRLLLPGND